MTVHRTLGLHFKLRARITDGVRRGSRTSRVGRRQVSAGDDRAGQGARRRRVGLPTVVADITPEDERSRRRTTVTADGEHVLTFDVARPPAMNRRDSGYVYSVTDDRLLRVPNEANGEVGVWPYGSAASVAFGDHPRADRLRSLDLGPARSRDSSSRAKPSSIPEDRSTCRRDSGLRPTTLSSSPTERDSHALRKISDNSHYRLTDRPSRRRGSALGVDGYMYSYLNVRTHGLSP